MNYQNSYVCDYLYTLSELWWIRVLSAQHNSLLLLVLLMETLFLVGNPFLMDERGWPHIFPHHQHSNVTLSWPIRVCIFLTCSYLFWEGCVTQDCWISVCLQIFSGTLGEKTILFSSRMVSFNCNVKPRATGAMFASSVGRFSENKANFRQSRAGRCRGKKGKERN